MDYIREKSGFNIDSAKELIDMGYHAPSVHCSYFASFQFMKYAIKKHSNKTYDELENESLGSSRGTHRYIIELTLSALKEAVNNNTEYIRVKRLTKDLKSYRVTSDYMNVQISSDDADKSLRMSEEIIRSIRSKLLRI